MKKTKGVKEVTQIPNDYPDLVKYGIERSFGKSKVPEALIELLKQYIPIHIGVGTIWSSKKEREKEVQQSELLRSKCRQLRKEISALDYTGVVTMVVNGFPLSITIHFSSEEDQKVIEFCETSIIEYDFEFNTNKQI